MADVMKLQVITPDRKFYSGDVTMVELTTTEGQVGIYPQHIPMTAIIAPGVLKIHEEGQVLEAALLSGFLTILPDKVTIMAETAEWPDEIDYNRAEEAKTRAERRLSDRGAGAQIDVLRAEMSLKRALVRLEIKD